METWDKKYTDIRIAELHPAIRDDVFNAINEVDQKLNIKLRVTDYFRSIEHQDGLYAKGRTQPGDIVTWVKGGYSYHNYGLAIDVVEIKDGKPIYDNPKWEQIADIIKSYGFEWGGDWKKKDKPHFQKTFGFTTHELFDRVNAGLTDNEGYVTLKDKI